MYGFPVRPSVSDVEVRLALPKERIRRDRLINERHDLGLLRFVGRGLRYVAVPGWRAGGGVEVPSSGPLRRLEAFAAV